MINTIRIKKGLDICLNGEASKNVKKVEALFYAVKPTDFDGVLPKLDVAESDKVEAGSVLFHDKHNTELLFTSPVSGTVKEIRRGEKRLLTEIVIQPDGNFTSVDFGIADPLKADKSEIIEKLRCSGLWTTIRQRPFEIIANPNQTPKAIFVSAFDSAPLAPDYNFIIERNAAMFQNGLNVLSRLAPVVNLNIDAKNHCQALLDIKNAVITKFEGPHPAGNIGTQINKISPINKGEVVWYCNPQDVITIGKLFATGCYDSTRLIAMVGSEVTEPCYIETHTGAQITRFTLNNVSTADKRFISGNVLTGNKIEADGFIGFYDQMLSVIPEGYNHEFLGWLLSGRNKYSSTRTLLFTPLKDKYTINTNLHGGHRAFVVTGEFEKVFPFDIYPLQLIKACMVGDIDLMENLGIYEVAPEDFALCEFVDPSKTNIQQIIKEGLETIRKETI